ncbi:hypothetical protein KAH37_05790 [bacterium]|nr:hypothetical protein [bacterium]
MKKVFYRFEPFLILFVALLYSYYHYSSQQEPPPVHREYDEKNRGSSLYFDEEIIAVLQKTVKNAQKTVDIVSFTCSESPLMITLRTAAERGVKVRLICGKKSNLLVGKMHYFLRSPSKGILHEKFVIKDGKDVVVTTGNISNIHHNNTALLLNNVPLLADILKKEVDDLEDNIFRRKCVDGCPFEKGVLYFSPGACRAVGTEIKKSVTSLSVALYTVTPRNPLFTALMKVIKRKVPVTLVVDDWSGSDKIVNKNVCLRAGYHGADARYDNRFVNGRNMLLHDKIAVIDKKTTILGSMNWTASACYRNRELILKLDDVAVAEEVEKHIMEMAQRGKSCVQ